MKIESMYELFLHNLKSAYYIEQNLISELEDLTENTTDEDFVDIFEKFIGESADHADRIDQVFDRIDESPELHRSRSFTGIVYEIDHLERDVGNTELLNLVYLDSVIKVKRLEISIYESLLMLTREIEVDNEAKELIDRNLQEDQKALKSLKNLKSGSTIENLLKKLKL